ncbi:hypothetical protein QE152_g54 [Popillia japonica]|uniref:Gustatory receptor n=1 Tax=Popillia japonica TaxID=7064 RepID=A0AAW1NCQ4_POPJA
MPSILEWMIYVLYYCLDMMLLIISMIISKIYNERLIKILNQISMLDQNLNAVGVKLDYPQIRKSSILALFFMVSINIIHKVTYIYADYTSVKDISASIYRCCLTVYVDYAQISHICLFSCIVLIAKNMLHKLTMRLEILLADQVGNNHETALKLYNDIFQFVKDFVEMSSLQLLFTFGIIVCIIVFHTFDLVVFAFHADKFDLKLYMMTILFSLCILLSGVSITGAYIVGSIIYHKQVS